MARGRGRGRGGRGRRGGRGGGSRGRKSKGKGKGDNNEVLRFANELTVDDVLSNDVTALANTHWASGTEAAPADFDAELIDTIYRTEIATGGDTNEGGPFRRRRTVLELSRYLELYLWPHFDGATATREHVLSILAMVNQKMRQGFMEVWPLFHSRPEAFDALFQRVIWMVRPPPAGTVDGPPARDGGDDDGLSVYEKTIYVRFLISAFQGLEDEAVRAQCLRLVSLPLWKRLGQRRAEKETHALFKEVPHLTKLWAYLTKLAKKKLSDKTRVKKAQMDAQINWLPDLIEAYVADCEAVPLTGDAPRPLVAYCEKFTEFLLDLLSQLPTRRFVNTLISDSALLVRLRASALGRRSDARLFKDLLAMLEASAYFAIDDYTGVALDAEEMERRHVARVTTLQRCAFKHFRSKLERLALAPINALSTPAALVDHLQFLEDGELRDLCVYLRLLDADSVRPYESRDVIIAILVAHHVRRASQLEETKQISLFPSELDLYNGSLLTDLQYRDDMCLALPKLNLQFLTMYDYLLHNFELYRLESTFGIREDIEDVVGRLNPRRDPVDRSLRFKGWARYGLPCRTPAIKFIQRPSLGDTKPAMVRLEVGYSISGVKSPKIKEEWEELRKGDAIFLAAVDPAHALDDRISKHESFSDRTGLRFVRGGEVISLTDKFGNEIDDFTEEGSIKGQERLVQIALDTAQYQRDVDAGEAALYSTLNILIRRNRRSNNFKAVLSSMVDMMGRATHIPDWLHDIFLGYGDPGAAHYTKMAKPGVALHLDWRDTFLDAAHAAEALGRDGATVTFAPTDDGSDPAPPFRCVFEPAGEGADASPPDVTVYSYQTPPRAPFEGANAPKNRVRFTPTQVEAIRSGMSHGLTLVVGPPGTGKTDVAVQIIANLYHSFPEQRIVLATKSNQALNQLFEKLTRLDIAGRHLLRLGHSGKDIRGEDFSRRGRVAYMLEERDLNLTKVTRLSVSLGDGDDAGYTCESAGHYWSTRVQAVWSDFLEAVGDGSATTGEAVAEAFPFTDFFGSTEAVFGDGDGATDGAEALAAAHRAFASLEVLFASLAECHAFELLRTPRDRGRYLITHQSRIIAMTCTYAALKRSELLELGFRYDNIVMEEAAQLMEIETLIPMVLQKDDFVSHNRLKRVIMIGDHRQLSPVVQGVAFQKYGHLDQSMFTRFIRLQVPAIHLDSQGRMRPELASLFNWRYENLGNLPHILERPEFARQNAGFAYPFQFIDVGDLNGVGESAPAAHFIQNLAEAEYTVAVFMYMRLVGYAADKISIITTYNGQKALIRDVLNTRCRDNPLFGLPRDVSTVDKFQGEQNDYILLSMVRTRMVGHVRDVRRLVVAMSRARLGLYVFGRKSLYENCYDIKPTFEHLLARPVQLQLVMNETHPSDRTEARGVGDEGVFAVADLAQMGQIVYQMAGEAARAEQARYELQVKEYEAQKAAAAAKARGQRDDDNAESDDDDDGVGDGGDEDAAAGGSGADVADMDGVTETTG